MATNLEFIKSASTSTNASSISVTDCFSAKYDVYRAILEIDEVGTELAIETRLIDGSGVDSTSNYDTAVLSMPATGSFAEYQNTNADKWQYTMYSEGSTGGFYVANIHLPYDSSSYTFLTLHTSTHYMAGGTSTLIGRKYIGVHKVTESITGIQVYGSSSNITSAKLSVYGVK